MCRPHRLHTFSFPSPGPTSEYRIAAVADGTVDAPVTVTLTAHDQFGNAVADENVGVTLVQTGTVSGAISNLVAFSAGTGAFNISRTVPETIVLTLSDSQSTGANVSATDTFVISNGLFKV